MKKIIVLFAFISLNALSYSQAPDSLVGVWQDNENLGSGWSNTFLLFGDGSYKFYTNQMDCSKRLISNNGKWRISDVEDAVIFSVENNVIIEGGTMVKSDGSCASDSMIAGGTSKTIKVNEVMDHAISKVYSEEKTGIQRKFIYIDAVKYWYFGDPKEMLNQFESK